MDGVQHKSNASLENGLNSKDNSPDMNKKINAEKAQAGAAWTQALTDGTAFN